MSPAPWQHLVEEGRALLTARGAVFDNVAFRGDALNVGVWAADPKRAVKIFLTPACLVRRDHIDVTGERPVVAADACADAALRAHLEHELAFVLSPARVAAQQAHYQSFMDLPEPLRRKLGGLGLTPRLFPPAMPDVLQLREGLLQARLLQGHDGVPVFMPLLDFVNHSGEGTSFSITEAGIGIEATASASGEVFVNYNVGDTFHLLNSYHYPCMSQFAYGTAMEFVTTAGDRVRIGRRYMDVRKGEDGLRQPVIEPVDNAVVLSHVWLGSLRSPRRPARSFVAAWDAAGRTGGLSVFSQIQRLNWLQMIDLQTAVDGLEGEAAGSVRAAIKLQMQRLAECLI